jgi:beta-lactamase class A
VAVAWPPGRPAWVVCVFVTDTRASLDARNEAIAEVGRTLAHSIAP